MAGYPCGRIAVLFLFMALLTSCSTLSFDKPKPYSESFADTANTSLGKEVSQWVDAHRGLSGFFPLIQGMDAMGARLRLAELAERSIDLQYFLISNDTAGQVLKKALLRAADRGVRVRLLVDDIFTRVPDRTLLLIDQHPNIEIRLFNPISRRGFYWLNFFADFERANRRMHNKSFTVDNQISVIGGRNIADEYFDLKTESLFVDLDVIAAGPIASAISISFDKFWNHTLAIPIDQVARNWDDEELQAVRADVAEQTKKIYDTVYKQALESQILRDLMIGRKPLFPAEARVLSDSPDKLISEISEEQMRLATDLREVLLSARNEIIAITPYYVPRGGGVQLLRNLIDRGVRVVVVTNSLASNNQTAVHGGYARYRKAVIETGAELYEARANAAGELQESDDDWHAMTLHTKAFLIDRRYLFVGSLNLDPRSIEINAEIGLLIDSEEMVGRLTSRLDERLSDLTYRVLLNEQGELEWHGRINGLEVVETSEPLATAWLRFKAWLLRIVPEGQL